MNNLRAFLLRLRNLFHKQALDRGLHDELAAHLELHIADNLRAGMSPAEARRVALLKLGGLEQTKESVRDARALPFLETLLQDLRYASRNLRRSPGFTVAAVLTLSLGIGGNTAIFSFADLLLNHPLSLPQLNRLESLDVMRSGGEETSLSAANFRDLRAGTVSLESLTCYQEWAANVLGNTGAEEYKGIRAGEDFFTVLEATPLQGRTFLPEEHRPGNQHVVILSYAFWQREFAADPRVTERTLRLDGLNYAIIGVMPASFQFPPGGQQFWVPLALDDAQASDRTHGTLAVLGRLRTGSTLEQSRAELNTVWSGLQARYPEVNRQLSLSVVSLRDRLVDQDSRQFATLFLCVAAFVLLIACANVANLQLARAAGRQRELSIRAALGAGRVRISRQLLTETLLLAAIGAAGGLLLALWGVSLMRANMPAQVWEICDVHGMRVDQRAFVFTLFAAVASGLLSGAVPVFRSSKVNLRDALETGGARVAGGGQRLRSVFVISEVILSVVLLIGAGLMVKGFFLLAAPQAAMQPQTLLTFHLNLPPSRYAAPQQRLAFYDQLLDRLHATPGVDGVSAASGLPYSFYENDMRVLSGESRDPAAGDLPTAMQESIAGDYFRVLRLPLREGRFFDPRDGARAPAVGIVSETMARRLWPGRPAFGQRLRLPERADNETWITIVGVVADTRHEVYDRSFRSILYLPLAQAPEQSMDIALRTSSDPHLLIPTVRSAVTELDAAQPVTLIQTMAEKVNQQASALQFVAGLMGLFGLVAILLSAAGIYGLIAYSVAERRREIGIRMALGAHPLHVLAMVVWQGVSLVTIGGAIGLLVGSILARFLSSLLYGVQDWDITIFAAVPLLLALVTIFATLLPARRAATVDPMIALRYE
jgi:putative ABC transport system permease protein